MLALIMSSTALLLLPTSSFLSWSTTSISLLLLPIIFILNNPQNPLSFFLTTKYLSLDSLSLLLISLTLWISGLMILASMKMKSPANSQNLFLFLIILLNTLLLLTFSASNTLMFYIFFESTLIPTLLIIIGWGYQPERLQAGMYLMLYTVAASLPLLISITTIFNNTCSLFLFNPFLTAPTQQIMFFLWWTITIMSFLAKMPMYLLHLWLPKAHVEAPVAGSMILAGLLLKLGSYGLIRFSFLFPNMNKNIAPSIIAITMWGAIITSLICLRQPDMKSLIAYSSIGHMALLTAGIMTNSMWGWESAILMMIAHGLCSSSLFSLANMQYEMTQTRNIFISKGLLSFFPIMSMFWFLSSAANMAAPPSLNLIAEIILLTSILSIDNMMFLLLASSSFLAAAYSLFLYTSTQHGMPMSSMNPLHILQARNYFIISLHLLPLFTLFTKMNILMS